MSGGRAQITAIGESASGVAQRLGGVSGTASRAVPAHGACAFVNRSVEAGKRASDAAVRRGRRRSSPPQFGQTSPRRRRAQSAQKVHSNVHTLASVVSGGRSRSQHSQFGLRIIIGGRPVQV